MLVPFKYQREWTFAHLIIAAIVLALYATSIATASDSLFPVRVSANARYLEDATGKPFLLQGDTAWSLMVQLTKEDTEEYLENRRQKGFNAILVNLIEKFYSDEPPKNKYGDQPFTTAGDFATPNESYFAHADWVIHKAQQKGILVVLNPCYTGFDPKGINSRDGWMQEAIANGPAKSRNYGRYIGKRYRNFSNIIWQAGGDTTIPVGSELDRNWLELLQGIKEHAPNHLWTAHWIRSTTARDQPTFAPFMDVDNAYPRSRTYFQTLRAYNRAPPRPTFVNEAYYEDTLFGSGKVGTPPLLRAQAYWALLSGATGHIFGSDHVWMFGGPRGTPSNPWPPLDWRTGMDRQGSREMVHVKKLFDGFAWHQLVPDQDHSVVTAGFGSFGVDDRTPGGDYVSAARTGDGSLVMAYVPSTGTEPRTITVDMATLCGAVQARWYNPTDGSYRAIAGSPFPNSGSREFATPGDNGSRTNDWVLVLETSSTQISRNETTAKPAPFRPNYDESKVPAYELPDPLVLQNGKAVTDAATWTQKRRPEVLERFRTEMYGRQPSAPAKLKYEVFDDTKGALDGKAVRRQVTIYFSDDRAGPQMDLLLYIPAAATKPVPVFLGLNFWGNHSVHSDRAIKLSQSWMRSNKDKGIVDHRATEASRGASASRWDIDAILGRGYGLATFYYGDIDPDYDDGFRNGVHPLFLKPGQEKPAPDEWGSIAAWSWGLSRALDYLEKDAAVDAKRVAVMGHSRLGKTSLWAGAEDERFAIVISNDSGCGGAALSRREFGETVRRISTGHPSWFCGNFAKYKAQVNDLPFDQHMLIALIAPRPVYVASAVQDRWSDPKGEFLSAYHADPVYRLLGTDGFGGKAPPSAQPAVDQPLTSGAIGYHVRSGVHDVTPYDWKCYLDFADRHFRLTAADTAIDETPRKRPPPENREESKVPPYKLPDPLVLNDGQRVTDAETWTRMRRPEILELFRSRMYGRCPPTPSKLEYHVFDDTRDALGGKAIRKQVTVYFSDDRAGPQMDLLLYIPAVATKPVPVFLGLNFWGNHTVHFDPGIKLSQSWMRASPDKKIVDHRATEASRGASASRWDIDAILGRGYGMATIYYGDIDPDIDDGFRNGVHSLFLKPSQEKPAPDEWGSIAAWSWGLSRALDYLEKDAAVDAKRVAVMGHSRLGKTSLWAGAEDERFAIVISNNSGCGGAALSRRVFGESVHQINYHYPHWFCDNFEKYNERVDDLPIDQHMLIALMAPRPVYVASADRDLHSDPRGEFQAALNAEPVYRLFNQAGLGVEDLPPLNQPLMGTIGYHIRSGVHDVTPYDWKCYLDFADRHYLASRFNVE